MNEGYLKLITNFTGAKGTTGGSYDNNTLIRLLSLKEKAEEEGKPFSKADWSRIIAATVNRNNNAGVTDFIEELNRR